MSRVAVSDNDQPSPLGHGHAVRIKRKVAFRLACLAAVGVVGWFTWTEVSARMGSRLTHYVSPPAEPDGPRVSALIPAGWRAESDTDCRGCLNIIIRPVPPDRRAHAWLPWLTKREEDYAQIQIMLVNRAFFRLTARPHDEFDAPLGDGVASISGGPAEPEARFVVEDFSGRPPAAVFGLVDEGPPGVGAQRFLFSPDRAWRVTLSYDRADLRAFLRTYGSVCRSLRVVHR